MSSRALNLIRSTPNEKQEIQRLNLYGIRCKSIYLCAISFVGVICEYRDFSLNAIGSVKNAVCIHIWWFLKLAQSGQGVPICTIGDQFIARRGLKPITKLGFDWSPMSTHSQCLLQSFLQN